MFWLEVLVFVSLSAAAELFVDEDDVVASLLTDRLLPLEIGCLLLSCILLLFLSQAAALSATLDVSWHCMAVLFVNCSTFLLSCHSRGFCIISSLMSTSLNVTRVLRRVMQKPLDAGMSGNSGNIFSSVRWERRD